MTPDQIDAFAEGLYQLATVDGVDQSEVAVIQEFLKETGTPPEKVDQLGKREFDASELPWALNTGHLRQVFLKTCWVLVRADGKVSDAERNLIRSFADVLGLTAQLADLEQEVSDVKL